LLRIITRHVFVILWGHNLIPLPGSAQNFERQVTVFSALKGNAFKYGGPAVTYVEYAKTGYTFVFVSTSVKNIGPDTITVSSGDFSIRDSEGMDTMKPQNYKRKDLYFILNQIPS
jgi:hypothetical protein